MGNIIHLQKPHFILEMLVQSPRLIQSSTIGWLMASLTNLTWLKI
jgi:hypothetical protein